MTTPNLISPEYLQQQQAMHRLKVYGNSGAKWDLLVAGICRRYGAADVLDYGCGTGELGRSLKGMGIVCKNYDPAVTSWGAPPTSADLVTCLDVLEHIEPDKIDAVVEDLKALVRVVLFVVVSLRPAGKTLPDGRNAHLLVHDSKWWMEKLTDRGRPFKIKRVWDQVVDEWSAILVPK